MDNDHKFAKLFEKDGRQYLVTKDTDDETSEPEVRVSTTNNNGHRLTISLKFGEDNWDARDEAFESIDETSASAGFANNAFMDF